MLTGRIVEGAAFAAANASILAILMVIFSDNKTFVASADLISLVLGTIFGPLIGTVLYEIDGFYLPFCTTGSLIFALAILSIFIVPKISATRENKTEFEHILENDDGGNEGRNLSVFVVFQHFTIILPLVNVAFSITLLAMLQATLEPELRRLGARQWETGAVFVTGSAAFIAGSILMSFVYKRVQRAYVGSASGLMLGAIAMSFVAPIRLVSYFTPSVTSIWISVAACMAFQASCVITPAYKQAHAAAMHLGFYDDIHTSMVLSGMYNGSYSVGTFVGGTLGGILVDLLGFPDMTLVFVIMGIMLVFVNVRALMMEDKACRNGSSP